MKPEEFTKAITFLTMIYDKEFTQEKTAVWYEFFKDTKLDIFKQALKRLSVKNKYLPSIAEIKQEIALINNPNLQINADDEWEQVLKLIREYGYYKHEKAMAQMKPLTANAVRQLGWYKLCSSDNIVWLKKEFIEIINNKKDNIESLEMLLEPTMTLAELTAKAKEYEERKLLN